MKKYLKIENLLEIPNLFKENVGLSKGKKM